MPAPMPRVHEESLHDRLEVVGRPSLGTGQRMHLEGGTGFTLIELIVVMAIVAVLASVGAVYGGRYVARRQLEGAAFGVVQQLRQVQAMAVFTRSYLKVTFDVPNNTCSFQTSTGGSPVVTKLSNSIGYASSVLGASFVGDTVHITSSVHSTTASPTVCTLYFGPMGTPLVEAVTSDTYPPTVPTVVADAQVDGKGISVVLATRTGDRIDIRISSVLGQATMEWQ